MKKIFYLLLVATMIFCLCSCGVSKKENMISSAATLDLKQVENEVEKNVSRAKKEYDGKIVKWTATVYSIDDGYVSMSTESHNGAALGGLFVYMDEDEIAKIDKFEEITIVGRLRIEHSFIRIRNAFVVD